VRTQAKELEIVSLAYPPKRDRSGMLPILHREQKRERNCYNLKASEFAFQVQKTSQLSNEMVIKLRKNITKKRPDFCIGTPKMFEELSTSVLKVH
jgi:hypothetical protein